MVVLSTDFSPAAGQFIPSVVRPCLCSFLTTLHIGAQDVGFWCSSFSLLLHAFSSLTANGCCLKSNNTVPGVNPESHMSAPSGVVGSAPRMGLARRFKRSWRLSRLPTSLGSHQSSLPSSATTWTPAIWTALTVSGRMPYILVRVRSLASAALAFFMHRLCCSLNVRCASIQIASHHVACVLNRTNPCPTLIVAARFGWRGFLWPRLPVNSAAMVFAVSNCSPHLLPHAILFAAHLARIETTWLTLLPVTTQPRSSTTDSPSASDKSCSTHLISPEV